MKLPPRLKMRVTYTSAPKYALITYRDNFVSVLALE
jgi:hypothetical protein